MKGRDSIAGNCVALFLCCRFGISSLSPGLDAGSLRRFDQFANSVRDIAPDAMLSLERRGIFEVIKKLLAVTFVL